jgi:hypothetical protein
MDKILGNQVIHQITIGPPMNGMQFRVGQEVHAGKHGRRKITKIQRSENSFYYFGVVVYITYIDVDGIDRVWRYDEKQAVSVVCDISQYVDN